MHKKRQKKSDQIPSSQPITLTDQHQAVLYHLIDNLLSPPLLGYPDFEKPLVLHRDASQKELKWY